MINFQNNEFLFVIRILGRILNQEEKLVILVIEQKTRPILFHIIIIFVHLNFNKKDTISFHYTSSCLFKTSMYFNAFHNSKGTYDSNCDISRIII